MPNNAHYKQYIEKGTNYEILDFNETEVVFLNHNNRLYARCCDIADIFYLERLDYIGKIKQHATEEVKYFRIKKDTLRMENRNLVSLFATIPDLFEAFSHYRGRTLQEHQMAPQTLAHLKNTLYELEEAYK